MIKKGQIYLHKKTKVPYGVIECENTYIQIGGEWKKAVRYIGAEKDKEFVRSLEEFMMKFERI